MGEKMWKGGKELKCEPKEVFTNTSLAAALSILHPLLPPPAAPMAQLVPSARRAAGQWDRGTAGQRSGNRAAEPCRERWQTGGMTPQGI